jgi:RimJ/RimL family protein N-acetyltransferase
MPMTCPQDYSAVETLRDGGTIEIRALKPADRPALEAAIDRTSAQSLYRRFFAVRTVFTEEQTQFFIDVDFQKHVALVAIANEGSRQVIVGGGRYVRVAPDTAEVAFMITDRYQGKGIGALLLRHLTAIAREAGLQHLIAEVLPENLPMLRLFERSGLAMSVRSESGAVHVTLDL